ncbi:RHS repeat-associated core domain-containing protein [Endozoicomonas acroporae]|uniref:RHS repeat-associated core domain-containing protein n=1 Tax=Endozoicomonas acroporae TaxID=1701104 RepID=UPI003D7A7C7D
MVKSAILAFAAFLPVQTTASAADAVGITPGEFRVNESGNATYSIPIDLPKGTAGLTPGLSLNYDSQGGNGHLGQGWSLGGLSTISRCRPTLEVEGYTNNSLSQFCLDGQKLIQMSGQAYGSSGAEYRTELDSHNKIISYGNSNGFPTYFKVWGKDGSVREYGNSSNSRIEGQSSSAPMIWAINKIQDNLQLNNNSIVFTYLEDNAKGEFILDKVTYAGNQWSAKLNYSDNRPDKKVFYASRHKNSVSKRLNSITVSNSGKLYRNYKLSYQTGAKTGASQLTKIQECSAIECFPATIFDWGKLESGFHSVKTVSLPGGSKTARPADINGDGLQDLIVVTSDNLYNYISDGTALKRGKLFHLRGIGNDSGNWNLLDFNFDGKDDLLYKDGTWKIRLSDGVDYIGSHINTGIPASGSILADVDGDGMVDIIHTDGSKAGNAAQPEPVLITDVTAPTRPPLPPELSNPGCGNGRHCMIRSFSTQTKTITVRYLKRNKNSSSSYPFLFSSPENVTNRFRLYTPDGIGLEIWKSYISEVSKKFRYDVNGDGKVDYLIKSYSLCIEHEFCSNSKRRELGWDIYASTGDGFTHYASVSDEDVIMVDLNGDSLPDKLDGQYFSLNTGKGFSRSQKLGFNLKTNRAISKSLNFLDYNGDGITDLFYASNNRHYVKIWNGQGYNSPIAMPTTYYGSENNFFIDINGDGARDFVNVGGALPPPPPPPPPPPLPPEWELPSCRGGHCEIMIRSVSFSSSETASATPMSVSRAATGSSLYIQLSKSSTITQDKITRIRSGLGAITDITYQPLTNKSVYKRGANGIKQRWGKGSPVFDLLGSTYVVSQVSSSAPSLPAGKSAINYASKSSVRYQYEAARIQGGGRGYLGFGKLITTDVQTGSVTETTYRQDFPYIGMPSSTVVKTATGALLSESTNTWDSKKNGKVYQPWLKSSMEKGYDLHTASLLNTVTTTQTIDGFGNVLNMSVTTEGGGISSTKTTVSQYTNDASKWHLGRLTRSSVTTTQGSHSETRTSAFEYHPVTGMLTKEIVEPDDPLYRTQTSYTYDAWGNQLTSTLSASGVPSRTTNNTYSADGLYLNSTTNALGQITRQVLERDTFGRPLRVADINGVETTFAFDTMGRKTGERHASGVGKDYAYYTCVNGPVACPPSGALVVEVKPLGGAPAWEVQDILGRTIRKVATGFDGQHIYTDSQYDNLSRPVRVSEPYFAGDPVYWNTTEYDVLGRVVKVTNANGDSDTIAYHDYSTVKTNAQGHNTTELRNSLGQLIKVIDNLGNTIDYKYDIQGNLTQTRQTAKDTGVSAITTITYDKMGRKVAMDDADKGQWKYTYNVLGQLTRQTDAKGQSVEFIYDLLGRKLNRIDRRADSTIEGNTTWAYDQNIKGALSEVSDSLSGYGQVYSYDAYGRPTGVGSTFDGEIYLQTTAYDNVGRVLQKTDAAGVSSGIRYLYNEHGYMEAIRDLTSNREWYRVNTLDARGNATVQTIGGLQQTKYYTPKTGFLERQTVGAAGIYVQHLNYQWDSIGNLSGRVDKSTSTTLTETFGYDGLNRLTQSTVGNTTDHYAYDGLGNITAKTGVGNYTYGQNGAGVHAVTHTSIGDISYQYDANGNMTAGDGRTLEYSTFDKPVRIQKNGHTTEFQYDINRSRFKRVDTDKNRDTTVTRYVGNVEFITRPSGNREVKRYINGVVIDTKTTRADSTTISSVQLLFKDHLGSVHTIMDGNSMTVLQRQSFDPFGLRRDPTNWQVLLEEQLSLFNTQYTTRGFTGHEQLDEVGLIHMNGRVYDAKLGRFLQADPFIQAVGNTQSFNRYSYVLNNPLNAVDPSGYFFKWIKKKAKKIVRSVIRTVAKVFGPELTNMVGSIVFGYFGGPIGVAAWNYEFGRAMGASSGQAFKSAAIAGASAWAFQSIGQQFSQTGSNATFWMRQGGVAHIGTHAITGGVISELQGGKFGHGFISAGFTKFATSNITWAANDDKWAGVAKRTSVASLIGGTTSALTGGKFANGARTAAMAHLFNAERKALKGFSEDTLNTHTTRVITRSDGIKQSYEGWLQEQLYGASAQMPQCSTLSVYVCSASIFIGGEVPDEFLSPAGKHLSSYSDVLGHLEKFDESAGKIGRVMPGLRRVINAGKSITHFNDAKLLCQAACDLYNRRMQSGG